MCWALWELLFFLPIFLYIYINQFLYIYSNTKCFANYIHYANSILMLRANVSKEINDIFVCFFFQVTLDQGILNKAKENQLQQFEQRNEHVQRSSSKRVSQKCCETSNKKQVSLLSENHSFFPSLHYDHRHCCLVLLSLA